MTNKVPMSNDQRSASLGRAVGLWALRLGHLLVIGAWSLSSVGCANQNEITAAKAADAYFAGNYEQSREVLRPLAKITDENFVLNNVRLGYASLPDYRLDEAEAALLNAYEVMNSVGVNDGGRSLGALLVDEKLKIWKGEPFERAMANFYLGVLYTMRQDPDNARAAFENALFKLRDYETGAKDDSFKEVQSNFAPAEIMLARTWQRLGRDDLARATFDAVIKRHPHLTAVADFETHQRSNLLLVIDYGVGPRKQTDFDGAIVGFGPPPDVAGMIPEPRVTIDGQPHPIAGLSRPTVDLLALAQDRKWQDIDTFRTIKSGVGTGLIAAGAVWGVKGAHESGGDQRRDLIASAALIGAGLILKAASQADVRQWETLPRAVFILPLQVPPGEHDIVIDFPGYGAGSQYWRGLIVPPQGDATYYIRMQRWNAGPFDFQGLAQPVVGLDTQMQP